MTRMLCFAILILISLQPSLVLADDATFKQGLEAFDKKDYDLAIACFSEVIRLDPQDVSAFYNRGVAYSRKKEYDKATSDYTEAIRLNPKHDLAFLSRAHAYKNRKEYGKAITGYKEVIQLNSDQARVAQAYNQIAWLQATCPEEKIRDGKAAVKHANKACELALAADKKVWYLDTLAAAHAEAGEFDEAVKYVRRVLESSELPKGQLEEVRGRLKLYQDHKPFRLDE